MRNIRKYSLSLKDRQVIHIPIGAELLSIEAVHGHPYLWALVRAGEKLESRQFATFCNGPVDDRFTRGSYVGTYRRSSEFAFHVFEILK